jgi:uncharacterized protein YbjT (DUF2867 family)
LGREVLPAALAAGYRVRALSRSDHRGDDVAWLRADLVSGGGVQAAVEGADVILHCASQPPGGRDVTATQNLLAAARRAAVGHIVYISIVGVDRIPLPYYRVKLRVEELLAESGVGHSVLRSTQFHDLIAGSFNVQRFFPVIFALRGIRFQPIHTGDVASRLVALADAGPAGRVPDIGGPEIRHHAEFGRIYLKSRGPRRPVVSVPVPGKIAAGYRTGAHLAAGNPVGGLRFEDYIRRY